MTKEKIKEEIGKLADTSKYPRTIKEIKDWQKKLNKLFIEYNKLTGKEYYTPLKN